MSTCKFFPRLQIALALRARAILAVFEKIYSFLFIPNCTRNHLITYTYSLSVFLFSFNSLWARQLATSLCQQEHPAAKKIPSWPNPQVLATLQESAARFQWWINSKPPSTASNDLWNLWTHNKTFYEFDFAGRKHGRNSWWNYTWKEIRCWIIA